MPKTNDLGTLIGNFTASIIAHVEAATRDRLRNSMLAAFGQAPRRGPGRPPKSAQKIAPKQTVRKKRARKPVTAARRAAMALQGRYLSVLRKLKGAARTRVQKVAKTTGAASAVKLGESLLK